MFPPVQESICESRESGTILSEHTPEMAVCVLTRGARNNSERTSYNTSHPSHTRLKERNPGLFEPNCISMEHPTADMTAAEGFTASCRQRRMVRENRVSGSCRGKSEVVIAANDGGYGLLHSAAARFGQLSDLLRPMLTVVRCRVTSSQQMRLALSGPVCRACATTSGRWGKWKMESVNSAWGALRGTCFALPLTPNDSSRLCGSSCAPHRRAGWTDARLSPDGLFDLFADSTRVSPGWQFGNGTPSCLLIPDGPSFSLRFSNPAPAPRRPCFQWVLHRFPAKLSREIGGPSFFGSFQVLLGAPRSLLARDSSPQTGTDRKGGGKCLIRSPPCGTYCARCAADRDSTCGGTACAGDHGCHEHTRFELRTGGRKRKEQKRSDAGLQRPLASTEMRNLGRGCRGQAGGSRVRPFLRGQARTDQALTRH